MDYFVLYSLSFTDTSYEHFTTPNDYDPSLIRPILVFLVFCRSFSVETRSPINP